jgi:hypothetical protein
MEELARTTALSFDENPSLRGTGYSGTFMWALGGNRAVYDLYGITAGVDDCWL